MVLRVLRVRDSRRGRGERGEKGEGGEEIGREKHCVLKILGLIFPARIAGKLFLRVFSKVKKKLSKIMQHIL